MPEAPEVANVLAYLERELTGRKIVGASITHPKLSDNMPAERMEKELINQHFRSFHRHGKYLIFELDDKVLTAHLRMEGKFILYSHMPEDEKDLKHIHACFRLDDGRVLCYRDTRKFGRMQLYDKQADWRNLPCLKKTGMDVLDPGLNGSVLMAKAGKKRIPIKTVLLDQSVLAGIGNIYADEILFASGINPAEPARNLSGEDWQAIADETRKLMKNAIEKGGTTIRTFSYGDQQHGSFQEALKVHQREGEPCSVCSHPVEKTVIGQRSTYFCPVCQKRKELE